MGAICMARTARRSVISALPLAALLLAAACTDVTVDPEAGASEQLPPPDRVLVYNFAITPQEVQLDSVGSEITKTFDGTAISAQEQQVGHAVADALAKHLVQNIQGMGLNAVRASGPVPATGTDVLILGQLVSIDEGNATERIVIGLGAGRSDVEARVQVYESMSGRTTPIETMEGTAKSSLMPGAAETMGAGALAGHLLVSAAITAGSQVANQTLSANVDSEAGRLADKVSDKLNALFVQQGWIPEGAGS
jgi:Domain of unknown function (DUF4410)